MKKYVIIGNSAAAIGAVQGIRSVDKDGSITIITDEAYHTYSRPLISYWLEGKVADDKIYYRELKRRLDNDKPRKYKSEYEDDKDKTTVEKMLDGMDGSDDPSDIMTDLLGSTYK